MPEEKKSQSPDALIGFLIVALVLVGALCVFVAFQALDRREFMAAAVAGIGAALSFGLNLNAISRQ